MKPEAAKRYRLGLIGARGYVGSELIQRLATHPDIELAFVSSRGREGQRLSVFEPDAPADMRYENLTPEQALSRDVDVLVLALPNGLAGEWARAYADAHSRTVLIDLSADFRFDPDWYYGLPELNRRAWRGQNRISNPGCYATAMQLAIAPMRGALAGPVQCFGVSGYSGAGTTPSDKNNLELLKDNLMPYALTGHIHEREASDRMGCEVQFMPHVAPHFRGLSITANLTLSRDFSLDEAEGVYRDFYRDEPFVGIQKQAPWLHSVAGTPNARVGGFTLSADGRRLVLVSVLDNLLKGAASQALQNINIALNLEETTGLL
ncbi:MAG TPA: N-acetyl-gamma-glutamyl-phosphate reductase [Arenimonas sp.]|nr:N-acetyl-gamma-glutamyl-phosphate reductase [Arenimonas sp.]